MFGLRSKRLRRAANFYALWGRGGEGGDLSVEFGKLKTKIGKFKSQDRVVPSFRVQSGTREILSVLGN